MDLTDGCDNMEWKLSEDEKEVSMECDGCFGGRDFEG